MERVALGVIACVGLLKVLHHVYLLGQKSQGKKRSTQGLLSDYDGRLSLQESKMHVSRNIGDVQLGPRLGSGSYGVVYAGWKGTAVAIKTIKHQRCGYASNEEVSREAKIAVASVHPNIVAVYDVYTEYISQNAFGDQSTAAYNLQTSVVMEMCDRGSLFKQRETGWSLLTGESQKGLQWVLRCLLDIVYAMEYLQSLSIVHGDLKCANVMCKSSSSDFRGFTCKVCDFGLSNTMSVISAQTGSSQPGTLIFAAPEVLDGGSLSASSDVYSFGMLAWHLFSQGALDSDMKEWQVHQQVVENGWRPALPSSLAPDIKDWISRCWLKDQDARPTFTELRHTLSEQLHASQRARKLDPLCERG